MASVILLVKLSNMDLAEIGVLAAGVEGEGGSSMVIRSLRSSLGFTGTKDLALMPYQIVISFSTFIHRITLTIYK